MAAWLDLGCIQDFVAGGESDSGLAYDVLCPACTTHHLVTISTLGRYLYRCEGAVVSGVIDQWALRRGHAIPVSKDPSLS